MDKLRKYLEIAFFVCINLIFAFSIIVWGLDYLLIIILNYIPQTIIPTWKMFDNVVFMVHILLFLMYHFAKFFLFPILYSFKNTFPNIHNFFDKIFDNSRKIIFLFLFIILLLVIDIISFKLIFKATVTPIRLSEFLFGFGLLPCYLIMYIYLKLRNKL